VHHPIHQPAISATGRQARPAVGWPTEARDATVAQVLEIYIRERIDKEAIVKVRPRTGIRNLNAYFDQALLRDVDIPASHAYADARRAGKVRPKLKHHSTRKAAEGTIRRELHVLNAAARFALKHRKIRPEEYAIDQGAEAPPWLRRVFIPNRTLLSTRNGEILAQGLHRNRLLYRRARDGSANAYAGTN